MQTDFFTDTLIQLMREVFAPQAISSEQRARIYARIASNRSVGAVEQMDFWPPPQRFHLTNQPLRISRMQMGRTNFGYSRILPRRRKPSNLPRFRYPYNCPYLRQNKGGIRTHVCDILPKLRALSVSHPVRDVM